MTQISLLLTDSLERRMTIEGARFTERGAIKPAFVLLRLRPLETEQFGIMDTHYQPKTDGQVVIRLANFDEMTSDERVDPLIEPSLAAT